MSPHRSVLLVAYWGGSNNLMGFVLARSGSLESVSLYSTMEPFPLSLLLLPGNQEASHL